MSNKIRVRYGIPGIIPAPKGPVKSKTPFNICPVYGVKIPAEPPNFVAKYGGPYFPPKENEAATPEDKEVMVNSFTIMCVDVDGNPYKLELIECDDCKCIVRSHNLDLNSGRPLCPRCKK